MRLLRVACYGLRAEYNQNDGGYFMYFRLWTYPSFYRGFRIFEIDFLSASADYPGVVRRRYGQVWIIIIFLSFCAHMKNKKDLCGLRGARVVYPTYIIIMWLAWARGVGKLLTDSHDKHQHKPVTYTCMCVGYNSWNPAMKKKKEKTIFGRKGWIHYTLWWCYIMRMYMRSSGFVVL